MLALWLFLLWVTPLKPWININMFHKHRQVQQGTAHSPFSELFMEPEVALSLPLMSSLAVSQNISHTSADFCLSFEVCSQGKKKKKKCLSTWVFSWRFDCRFASTSHCLRSYFHCFPLLSILLGCDLSSPEHDLSYSWFTSPWLHSHSICPCPGSSPVSLLLPIFNLIPG